jgi:hypothetical protein
MKTHTTMLSSLAIAALATVTLNSTEALAKSGGGGGGGMRSFSSARSFSAARTSPVVIKQFKTVTPTTVKKLNTTVVRDHRKTIIATGTTVVRDHRIKNVIVRDHRNLDPIKLPGGISVTPPAGTTTPTGTPGGVSVTPTPGGTIHLPPGSVLNPPGGTTTPGGTIHLPPGGVVVGPIGPIKPPGGGVVVDPVHPPAGPIGPIKPPGGGVIVVDPLPPKNPPAPPAPPPVVDHPHSHPSVSVGLGVVAAPEATDPPGCTYERTVRHTPGVGLQRVIIKVCPDA